mgnify:CR=1 FL=1
MIFAYLEWKKGSNIVIQIEMKRVFTVLALCLAVQMANAQSGVQSVLNQLLGSGATTDAVSSIIENVVGNAVSKLDLSIEGTWTYSQPEVQFKSDNLLAQAGGAAATTKIENTLGKLYGKIGINSSLSYTFNSDQTFTQTIKIGSTVKTLKGTYTLDTDNKVISFATGYFGFLGTAEKTAAQIKKELYDLACNASVTAAGEKVYISVSGLSENMEAALAIIEDKIANAKGDDAVLANYKANMFRQRANSKTNQRACYSMLTQYVNYGKNNPATYVLSNSEIQALTSEQLLDEIKNALGYEQMITYYGPMEMADVIATVEKYHNTPAELKKYPKNEDFKLQVNDEAKIVIAPYNAKQIYMIQYSNTGKEVFDPAQNNCIATMYNEYFGGGMNSIVFQEMREARGLAYSANARYAAPGKKDQTYYFTTFIATQNDKMMDAVNAFDEIVNQMPQSEAAFNIAKENLVAYHRTRRLLGSDVINYYQNLKKLGFDCSVDPRKAEFEKVQQFTLQDVIDFQKEVIKDRKYVIGILGTEKDLDMKALTPEKYGKVERVSLEDIFGY